MIDIVLRKWQTFLYNYQWSDYSFLFKGFIPRATVAIPLVGYLVIFNDGLAQYLSFDILAPSTQKNDIISTSVRLRTIYFGLVCLGIGSSIYYLRRPFVIKKGATFDEYKAAMMNIASPSMFANMHGEIRYSGFDPWTLDGKYYDKDYEDFMEMGTGTRPGRSIRDAYDEGSKSDWPEAVSRYEPMLTGIIRETYFREGRKRRLSLSACLFATFLGYFLLFIPSFSLFLQVLISSIPQLRNQSG